MLDAEYILGMIADGYSYQEIHDETGARFSEIRQIVQNARDNETEEKEMGRGPNISQETKDKVMEMTLEGASRREIAEKLGIGRTSVDRIITAMKIDEPQAAATVEGSVENTSESVDVSENIIPDISENVKTLHRLEFFNSSEEQVVIESVTDRIEFYDKKIAELSGTIKIYERKRVSLCDILKRNGYGDVLKIMESLKERNGTNET